MHRLLTILFAFVLQSNAVTSELIDDVQDRGNFIDRAISASITPTELDQTTVLKATQMSRGTALEMYVQPTKSGVLRQLLYPSSSTHALGSYQHHFRASAAFGQGSIRASQQLQSLQHNPVQYMQPMLPTTLKRFQSVSAAASAEQSSPVQKKISVLAGDGIGPEVMEQALRVLDMVAEKFGHQFTYTKALIGGAAYDKYESHFPDETMKTCQESDAILFGSVGGPVDELLLPKWKGCEANSLLSLRKTFKFSTNIRPAKVYKGLQDICPLKDRIIADGIDVVIFRELLGDLYFGKHETTTVDGVRKAEDQATYDEQQIRIIMHAAFKAAQQRKRKLHSVDKANVLDTSKLWRTVADEVAKEYPDVELIHLLVDNCAMQLIVNPGQFDVIVTSNMFGDILSDAAAVLPGSLGLMPSASLNDEGFGMYEPSGGSAPRLTGQNKANPIAQILSAAMMLRYSFALDKEAAAIEMAIQQALDSGARTKDIAGKGDKILSTSEMTDSILQKMREI
eukprot:gnl/TRDRNA2_/TRDRNA2_157001_c0_seq1.p1 gnl/TRDRNA2_/TRDRNA2_157001_c0~~gnl/TRDRNA2_/TRDRNA2_157001_c0_seq1.p1  ORF type:complete len:510 (-),score=88.49 gnl/TRDRNA2_/TRDRNA2_157001_c0_seq1:408-1937(-)